MSIWRKMTVCALGCALVMSQGMVSFAQEDVDLGAGEDVMVEQSQMPRQGAGVGSILTPEDDGIQEGLLGTISMGSSADLGIIGLDSEGESADTDTVVLDDIGLTLRIQGAYMLQNAEDAGFYYIDTWGEHGIPNMMVGSFQTDTADGFFDRYTEYMRQSRPDITVAEGPSSVMLQDKTLQKIVYNYAIQGYTVRDTRYIWPASNNTLYMFVKREIPELDYMLGNSLEDIIAAAAVTGSQVQPETTAPQPETTAPQPETTAPQPQTTAPSGGTELYVKNADSSWTVTTDYYTMTIPPAWTGHFDCEILQPYAGGYDLKVVNKESVDDNYGGHLFTVMLIPASEDYTSLPSYDYLGTMETPSGTYNMVIQYPTDVQTGGIWKDFYDILNGDKNSAITTIRPVAGSVWTLPNGQVVSGDSGSSQGSITNTPETTAPQPETTAPQPETSVLQPETTAPQPETTVTSSGNILGTTSGNSYYNDLFGFTFNAPATWILANPDQLVSLNEGLTTDQYVSGIESGVPVCIAYAQSADGMEVMNIVVENGKSFLDPSITSLTQEDIRTIFEEGLPYASSSLESLGATVTDVSLNTINCMGQTCYTIDIRFDYQGMSGIQRQIAIPAGTYLALITARSVNGDNTQATFNMFSAASGN